MQIFVNTKYDFVKWRFHAVAFSLIWMIVGAAMFVKHGINWGIDFAGGANIILKFKDKVPVDRLRGLLPEATIQQYDKPEANAVLIRLPEQKKESDYAGNTLHCPESGSGQREGRPELPRPRGHRRPALPGRPRPQGNEPRRAQVLRDRRAEHHQ